MRHRGATNRRGRAKNGSTVSIAVQKKIPGNAKTAYL